MQYSNKDIYSANGVFLRPAAPHADANVRVIYNGLLAENGAEAVFAHIGFGSTWQHQKDYRLDKELDGFTTVIPVRYEGTLQFCFKDGANNWDNNNGRNYSFETI